MAEWADRYVANLRLLKVPFQIGPLWNVQHQKRGDWYEGQPVGTIDHHFVNRYTSTDGVTMLTKGYSGGPSAPVVNQYIADVTQDPTDDGMVYLICQHPTGHPGKGSRDVLTRVRAGKVTSEDAAAAGRPDDLPQSEAEKWYYGTECQNPGDGTPLTAAQMSSLVRADAAFCRAIGRSAASVIQHRTHSSRKSDIHPKALNAADHIAAVQAILDGWPQVSGVSRDASFLGRLLHW